ncbi:MAG: CPBP family glutamic-type intramembrane protease [Pseudomonadota bacterium]
MGERREDHPRVGLAFVLCLCGFVGLVLLLNQYVVPFLGPFDPAVTGTRLRWVAIALFVPATVEELIFRAPLLRHPRPAAMILSLTAFVMWHPLQALFRPGFAAIFTNWGFLFAACALGACATVLTIYSHRLWPAIIFHWAAIAGWILLYGGPAIAQ